MKYINTTKTMLYKSKLKGSFGRIYPISLVIIYILCIVEVMIRWKLEQSGMEILLIPALSMVIFGLFFLVMGILQWLRYRLFVFPWLGFHLGLGCILMIFFYPSPQPLNTTLYVGNLLLVILIILIKWPVLAGQEKYESNARRIFKLASNLITDTSNGFTTRPFSAGKIDIEEADIEGFIRFIDGKFIGRSFYHDDVIYISFSLNKSVLRISDPKEVSYMALDKSGELSVRIAEQDYKQYRDKYNFDQLCASLAQVFIRFLNYYREGNEYRIITELKTTR